MNSVADRLAQRSFESVAPKNVHAASNGDTVVAAIGHEDAASGGQRFAWIEHSAPMFVGLGIAYFGLEPRVP